MEKDLADRTRSPLARPAEARGHRCLLSGGRCSCPFAGHGGGDWKVMGRVPDESFQCAVFMKPAQGLNQVLEGKSECFHFQPSDVEGSTGLGRERGLRAPRARSWEELQGAQGSPAFPTLPGHAVEANTLHPVKTGALFLARTAEGTSWTGPGGAGLKRGLGLRGQPVLFLPRYLLCLHGPSSSTTPRPWLPGHVV